MKILFLGNSHLASFKVAISKDPECFNHNIDFLAGTDGRGNFFKQLRLRNETELYLTENAHEIHAKFWKDSYGDQDYVDVSCYDHVVLFGLVKQPNPWLRLNVLEMNNIPAERYNRPPISVDYYAEVAKAQYLYEYVNSIVDLIKLDKTRISLIPIPLVSMEAEYHDSQYAVPKSWVSLSSEEKEAFFENEKTRYLDFWRGHGINVILPYRETISEGYRCVPEFSYGAFGSGNYADASTPQYNSSKLEDYVHKNTDYALLQLDQLKKELEQL